jgi:phosphoribosylglycinamide formyltransferase-1
MKKIVVFASGTGSNFEAILKKHKVCGLFVDKDCNAVNIAKSNQIAVYKYKKDWDRIISKLDEIKPDLIVLAGFMRILPKKFIAKFFLKIINIHPSILPHYTGLNAIERSYNGKDKPLGVTIHFVDVGMDTGPIIAQKELIRVSGESLEDFEKRLHKVEHELYPKVIGELLQKPIKYVVLSACLAGKNVRYDGKNKLNNSVMLFIDKNKLEFKEVCPELESGFSIPRETMDRLKNGKVLSATGVDYTKKLEEGALKTYKGIEEISDQAIYILKENSPSCGTSKQLGMFYELLKKKGKTLIFSEKYFDELYK